MTIPRVSNSNGTITDDISNDFCGVTYESVFTYFSMCESSPNTNCTSDPCNDDIWLSWCNKENRTELDVGLEGGKLENGTIISVFCPNTIQHCTNKTSKVMIFNSEISKLYPAICLTISDVFFSYM